MCAPSDSYFIEKESFGALILSEPKANDPVVSINRNESTGSTAEKIKKLKKKTKTKKKKAIEKCIIFDPYLRTIPKISDRNLSQPVSANLFSNPSA